MKDLYILGDTIEIVAALDDSLVTVNTVLASCFLKERIYRRTIGGIALTLLGASLVVLFCCATNERAYSPDDAPQLAGAEDGASAEEEDGGDDGYVAEEPEDW